MRVLLIHPEDELQAGPWARQRWERALDLGKAGEEAYGEAAQSLGCPISGLSEFREGFHEIRRARELIRVGFGRLEDAYGLDWWELTSIEIHHLIEIAFLMGELGKTLDPSDEVYVSRPCFHADVLRLSLGSRLHTFTPTDARKHGGPAHYFRVARKFPAAQLLEIFWDKTDPGYQLRGRLNGRPKPQKGPVVLLPTCYVNVTRTAVAYAETLPDANFLLVTTRRSGWTKNLPANVSASWLRQYASIGNRSRKAEHKDLAQRWERLRSELNAVPEFSVLSELSAFHSIEQQIAVGLEIRDAWRNVFDSEPVSAVICADDSNPPTHIPLLLAKHRGLPAVSCHHGALDGRYMFKRSHADVLLAKGRMEEDYLVRQCGIERQVVEVGAPAGSPNLQPARATGEKSSILFFSEPYELTGGRPRSYYRDVLPLLADLALAEGKTLVVKLHPSESLAERKQILSEVLRSEQVERLKIVEGSLNRALLDDAWCGITVISTAAVECARLGVPCFLCAWLEVWPYGYVAQFERFGVGLRLNDRSEIRNIPAVLSHYRVDSRIRENCWSAISAGRLRSLLSNDTKHPADDVTTKSA